MIQPRDIRLGVALEGETDDIIVRRTNREVCEWEVFAARHNLPTTAHTLASTWQAWKATKLAGMHNESFDAWQRRVIEVYACLDDGRRLIPGPNGELQAVGDPIELVDDNPETAQVWPDPTN